MVSVPVLVPIAVGVKVTVIVQLLPEPTGLTQLLVCAKSPLVLMLDMLNGTLWLFFKVTVCGELGVPTV